MEQTGNHLVPRIQGRMHVTKPPFYYWLASGMQTLTSLPDRVAVRLPSVLAALGLIGCVFWFMRRMGYARAALPMAFMLAGFSALYENGRVANFDVVLTFFSFSAVAAFYIHTRQGGMGWLLMAGACFALALLAKATPALLLVLWPIMVLLFFQHRVKYIFNPWVVLFVIVLPLVIGSAWFVGMAIFSPEARQVFISEGLVPFGVKVARTKAPHFEPIYYYFPNLLKITAPAVLLMPLLVWRLIRTKGYQRDRSDLRWVLYSFIGIFVVFSLIAQKQTSYMVSMLPFLAIMFGDALTAAIETGHWRRWIRGLCWLAAGVLLLAVPGLYWYFAQIIANQTIAIPAAVAALALAVILIILSARNSSYASLLGGAWIGWVFLALIFYGSFNVWDGEFKTGDVYAKSYYSASHWDSVFQKYPVFKKIFRTTKRFQQYDSDESKSGKESGKTDSKKSDNSDSEE